jgi:hypothetical protein
VHDHFSPAREPDSRHLQIDESWRGYGLLADLASASLARLRACETPGVRFVMRLQENWKPKVDDLARGQLTQEFCPGSDLDAVLEQESVVLDGRVIDADVHVGRGRHALPLRLVGVQTPQGDCCFLTNLPPGSAHGRSPTSTACAGRWNAASGWIHRSTAWMRSTPSGRAP